MMQNSKAFFISALFGTFTKKNYVIKTVELEITQTSIQKIFAGKVDQRLLGSVFKYFKIDI